MRMAGSIVLGLMAASALAVAKGSQVSIPGTSAEAAPAVGDILEHFPRDRVGYLTKIHRFCANAENAQSDVCMLADDIATWSGAYDNHAVAIVPPVALPPEASGYVPVAPVPLIASLARDRRVVIINEVHDNPETRILPYDLLAPLRKQGFDTMAMETILPTDKGLQARGYPVFTSGYYTREPAMGRIVREAIRLGYRVVGYDSLAAGNNDVAAREQSQATNLASLVMSGGGHRVYVVAGLAHAYKKVGGYLGGQVPMATRLADLIHEEPLSVDQVYTFDGATGHSLPKEGFYAFARDGKTWSAAPGQFDVSVVAKVDRTLPARSAWLRLSPSLTLVTVDTEPCKGRPCIVAAYRPGDSADATPLDLTEVPVGKKTVDLLLPDGERELRYSGAGGTTP